jgi:hypothetical protein
VPLVPQGAYFAEDFDSWPDGGCQDGGPTSACNGSSISGGASVGAFPQCLSGKCWRGQWTGNETEARFRPENGFQRPADDRMFARLYFQIGSDFQSGSPATFKVNRLIANSGGELDVYMWDSFIEMNNTNRGAGIDGNQLCWVPFDPTEHIGEWIKLEWYWKHNSSGQNNGECHLWVTYGDGSVDQSHLTGLKLYPNPAGIDRSAWIFANVSNYGAWPYDSKTIFMDEVCIGDSINDRTGSCATE